ncbi:guanitoxin biosynthesis heme-dependent pre-guanitoxin N-hydroxylase GntA [Hyphomonas sp. NPDC076900]|uniref:guanitoxin biosynthesis heme-dependent pre-guanitoxin N-hydroxylase GntA n=1 Tax=unclassified Hyphomonas TaxID=2630699 RepID=UPI003D087D20
MITLSDTNEYKDELTEFIRSDSFPCVGAKSALARNELVVGLYEDITTPAHDIELREDLLGFIRNLDKTGPVVQSFTAIFRGPDTLSEAAFEKALWNRLQCLHNLDAVTGAPWAEGTSPDPSSPHFSVSVCGEAFFVIGLHPGASRPARRFSHPALVFNSHDQFERLRTDGRFDQMKSIIREREKASAGSVNPMLTDFGERSEARQYSGRLVGDDWTCPFKPKV